jgi:aspartate aminotransferase/aminotransferase
MATLNPGDEVLMQEPLWVSYPEQVRLSRGVPVQIPNDASLDSFERALTDRTRLLGPEQPE